MTLITEALTYLPYISNNTRNISPFAVFENRMKPQSPITGRIESFTVGFEIILSNCQHTGVEPDTTVLKTKLRLRTLRILSAACFSANLTFFSGLIYTAAIIIHLL